MPTLATLGECPGLGQIWEDQDREISRGPALSLWQEILSWMLQTQVVDFSVPLHLPSLTLCGTNTFPQLLMLLEAAWALRQQHLLGLCFPTTCAPMPLDVFCPSVPSLLQLHSPYVQTWILKLLFRERRVRVLIVIVYIWIKYVYVSANNVFFCILCKLMHNIWLCREVFRVLYSIPEERRNWPKVLRTAALDQKGSMHIHWPKGRFVTDRLICILFNWWP